MASERKFVTENIRRHLLREYMMAKVGRAGFGGLDVQRTPMGTRVTLMTERPGLVIGRRGEAIKMLTKAIEEEFKFNNPQIEVQEVPNPNLNAQIMAEKLANALERGWHFRRAGHSTVRRIMDSGARGCQVVIAGKLTGARHRTEKFKEGHIKYCGQAKLDFMEHGFATAKLKPGVMGITVQIMNPNARLPDEIDIIPPPPEAAPAVEAPKPAAEMAAEEKKAAEAVQALKKEAAPAAGAVAKPKKPRKKKAEGAPEGPTPATTPSGTPASPGAEEKKVVRKRKKKEPTDAAAVPAKPTTEAITEVKPEAITLVEPKPLAEVPEKKPEEKKAESPPVEEKKEA